MKAIKTLSVGLVAFALPLVAMAQPNPSNSGYRSNSPDLEPVSDFLGALGGIVNTLIPLLIAVALVVFFWGLVRYIWNSSSEGAKSGRDLMIWGLIALFVMVSVWGIISLAQGAFGISGYEKVPLPCVDTNPGSSGYAGDC
jgi:hypothetical protein